jgi:hypothetical protein
MKFTIELLSSRASRFASIGHDLNVAETGLIAHLSPCFNSALNEHPAPLPACYTPPNGRIRCSRNLKHLIREAGYAIKSEQRRKMLDEIAAE